MLELLDSLPSLPLLSIAGSIGVISAAVALGIRHGIDWDHIAAITDITSTTSGSMEEEEAWLVREPAFMLTDESHHSMARRRSKRAGAAAEAAAATAARPALGGHWHGPAGHLHGHRNGRAAEQGAGGLGAFVERQRPALLLGTMYALGHGSVVLALGLLAILAREFLPDWIDPVMERVVGVTLLFLAAYLFYSLYRFFRGGAEFRLRSRWMLVFAGVRNTWGAIRARLFGRPHTHVHETQQYGVRTAVGIGMIHGVGAETGTQALVIATAVGAESQTTGVIALVSFLVGLLISNSLVTVVSTAGFVSAARRQAIYVAAGFFAAVFSLFVGLFFILNSTDILPDLDRYLGWIGGPAG